MFYPLSNFRVHPCRVEVLLPRYSTLQPARSSSQAERLSHTHTYTHAHNDAALAKLYVGYSANKASTV